MLKNPLVTDNSGFKVEKPFDYLSSRSWLKSPFGHRQFFHQDWGWKAPSVTDNSFVKIKVEKPLWSHTIPLSRSRLKSPLVVDCSFVKIEVENPLSCRQFLRQDQCWKAPWSQTTPVSRLKSPLITFRQDRGWKALWSQTIPLSRSRLKSPLVADSSFVKIEVEKPLSLDNSFVEIDVEKPLGHKQLWFQHWIALWLPFIEIKVKKPFWSQTIPLSRSMLRSPLGVNSSFVKIKAEKPLSRR